MKANVRELALLFIYSIVTATLLSFPDEFFEYRVSISEFLRPDVLPGGLVYLLDDNCSIAVLTT